MTKAILITGCSSGIGLCTAQTLKQRGYRVFATTRKQVDVDKLAQLGLESLALDLNDSHSIQTTVAEILHRTDNQLYGLINNAAYGQLGAVEDLTRETLRHQFETNLFGLLELTNYIIPVMRTQGNGRIINVSSILGFMCVPYYGAYNASKYALEGLTDTLRLELHGSGIHVSLIEPGAIRTQFGENARSKFRQFDNTHSLHKNAYLKIQEKKRSSSNNAFSLPPDAVVKKIIHALESAHPKIRYRVTWPTHLLAILKRLLPDSAMDWIGRKN